MKIVIAGGTGFLGGAITRRLVAEGNSVTVLSREPGRVNRVLPPGVATAYWDGVTIGEWARAVDGSDAILNFTGASVGSGRWTQRKKRDLMESRRAPAEALVTAISRAAKRPGVLVSASGVGYYGDRGDEPLSEEAKCGSGFLAEMGVEWERVVSSASDLGVRVVPMRMGVVLGAGGGVVGRMVLPYRLFVGGILGSGKQWFPWVHRDDVAGVVHFVLNHDEMVGPINVVAPEAVTMRQFGKTLGHALQRPTWLPVPAFALRLLLGEMSEMVLASQRAVPGVLMKGGYQFKHPGLQSALASLSL
jgi:uncharacterized protein